MAHFAHLSMLSAEPSFVIGASILPQGAAARSSVDSRAKQVGVGSIHADASMSQWKARAAFIGLVAVAGNVRKQRRQLRSTKSVAQQCATTTAQMWTLKVEDVVLSEPVKVGTVAPEKSLSAYGGRPLSELGSAKMAYGASLDPVGPNPAVAGEEMFEVKVPALNMPGIGDIQPIATCIARKKPSGVQIESKKVQVLRDGNDALQDMHFSMLVDMLWIDTADKQEIVFKGSFKFGMQPISGMSQDVVESVGNKAMGMSVDMLAKGFVRSFVEDYERWATGS